MSWPEICLQWSSISKWFGPIKTLSSSTLYCPNFCNEILCSMCVFLANFQLFQIIKLFPGAKLKNKRLIWQVSTHSSLPSNMRSQFQIYMKESSLMSDKKSWLCIHSWVYYIIFLNFGFSSFPTSKRMYITLLGNKRFTINEMT